jgi:hypothetical protein
MPSTAENDQMSLIEPISDAPMVERQSLTGIPGERPTNLDHQMKLDQEVEEFLLQGVVVVVGVWVK